MTTESSKQTLDSTDMIMPTQKLVGVTREKYIQRWRDETQQTIRESAPSSITHHLSIVVATGNEPENIKSLLESLQKAFDGVCVEVIFVDDPSLRASPGGDTTPEVIKDAARTMNSAQFQIHLEHRPAKDAQTGGLGTAIVHGLSKAQAKHIAVVHVGFQFHAEQLRVLYDQGITHNADLVVASHSRKKSNRRELADRRVPVYLKWLVRLLFPGQPRHISDPWSDCFLLRRELLENVTLRPLSDNILLEVLIRCQWQQALEVLYDPSEAPVSQSIQTRQHMSPLQNGTPLLEIEAPAPQNGTPLLEIEAPVPQNGTPLLETEVPVLQVETSLPETEAPILQTEVLVDTPVPQNGTSLPQIETDLPENEASVLQVETSLPEIEAPLLETETPILQTEAPLLETEAPVLQTEVLVDAPTPQNGTSLPQTETDLPETEAPVLQVETSLPETEVPVLQTEAPLLEIETPVLQTEALVDAPTPQNGTSLPQTETDLPETEAPVLQTEVLVDTPAPQNGTSLPQTETELPETEAPVLQTEKAPLLETEAPVLQTEILVDTPAPQNGTPQTKTSLPETETPVPQVETDLPKTEAPVLQTKLDREHIQRLWREVPAAGRIGKISLLLLLNSLLLSVLLIMDKFFPWLLSNFSTFVFVVIAGLDLVILNRFIFPTPIVRGATSSEESATLEALAKKESEEAEVDPKQKLQLGRNISDRFSSKVAVALIILTIGWISYIRPGALLVLVAMCIGSAIVFTTNVRREQAITMLLAITTGVATVDYVSWRFAVTNWHGWWIAVPLLFAETLGALHGLGFQFTVWPWSPPKFEKSKCQTLHPIFIFIPTVNEGVTILRPTLEGIIAARDKYLAEYPKAQITIVLCNDGRVARAANWEETEALAQELGVCCITRTIGGGAKAGNIENARKMLQATGDALLVIFDADQVAKPDFLLKTIPPFSDPKMGWVQTGQYYANLDNPVSRWADDQQSMFYNLLCPGKAALNASFICGTNVVIRAAALDEIGGLPQNSVTEDFAASIALHPSWRSIYLTDVLATGLGPLDVPSYLKQQSRWAIGTLGVLRTHWRDIFLPKKNGLRIGQRVHYFLACTHYLCGLRDLIYLISPILFIFTGIPAVGGTTIGEYLSHFVPYALITIIAMWYVARNITGIRGIVIGFGSFPVLIGSLLSVILQRKVGFAVTSKQRGGKRSLGYLHVYLFAFLLCVISLFWATLATGQKQVALFISVLWVIYSMLMLGSFLWLNFKDMRFQTVAQSSKTTNETIANQPYPAKLSRRRQGLYPVWKLGLAVSLACPILAHSSLSALMAFTDHPSTPFVLKAEKAPYFGISLPHQLLKDQAGLLERDLGTQFSITGRTQDITDQFDTSWANQLAAGQGRPWITLQFGEFDNHHLPPLDANLPAIYNGVHDQDLRRWAEEIRDYDKPVYMTILLHVDKNWSLSSAVANGGIPQDVPKAWTHIQSVFHAVGANNVAWIWAPADPLHDQDYRPPLANIDGVLQDFINYSGDKWGDPQTVLHDLVMRYPAKPIIVETSVDGPPDGPATRKAAWLTQLGEAINATPQVHALLYHEGGPDLNPDQQKIKSWSLASDPASLAAVQHIISVLHQKARNHP
jgi:cellulose synthase/poly-beta-1,6-N-acetylglucosamine synthase-like glycosyltransferase